MRWNRLQTIRLLQPENWGAPSLRGKKVSQKNFMREEMQRLPNKTVFYKFTG